MPPDSHSPQDAAFDINIIDPQALDTPGGLQNALRTIEAICYRGDPEISRMVEALGGRSYILEYIISVLEDGAYTKFSKWIVAGFPGSATSQTTDTIGVRLLQRFATSLIYVEYPSAADVPPNLRVFQRKVELSVDTLKHLQEGTDSVLEDMNTSPVGRKKGKSATDNHRIDPLPFNYLGIAAPTTDMEVRDACKKVLLQLRGILENYLVILRRPALSQIFRSVYMEAKQPLEGEPDQSRDPASSMVQLMKAALCFENLKGSGAWSIMFSTRAQKDLRDVKRADYATFRTVMRKLKQLSQGHFSDGESLTSPEMKLPIYEAKITEDARIVYQIDCILDFRNPNAVDSQYECQVIRVFSISILRHRGFWDNLSRQLQRRGPDYIKRCTFRNKPISTGNNAILPALFPPSANEVQGSTSRIKVSEEDMEDIHSTLVLDKFVMLSQPLLNSILAEREVAHLFSLSPREQEIIEHFSSCYVIGRSGTGKTTTMLFKMLGIQRIWERYPDMGPKPRQVFVTQSRVLAMKVKEEFEERMLSLKADSRKKLRMMQKDVEQEIEYVDQDDNKRWRSDLPERFSELLDDHFPLFITYDRLCTMLQNDIIQGNHNDNFILPKVHAPEDEATSSTTPTSPPMSRLRAGFGSMSSSDYMQLSRRNFVSYGVFLTSYWDHLPQTLTRALDPALVFGEFLGVIKGSEDTIGTKHGYLDQKVYKSLSVRSKATFSHKRDEIYGLFMAYTKLKGRRGDYDAADRTHYILEKLCEIGLAGRKVDFLYVDEVQDNLLIDTLLLRTICVNHHGLFWAGDTAQTISVGSSFQFRDLKAFQHRVEEQLSFDLGIVPAEPKTFQLVLNYRSHGGIVDCARSVVELLTRYWPYSIDVLQPEGAITDGVQPIFFTGQENADLEKSFVGNCQGGVIEFGADQCILVRNDAAKEKLRQRVGNNLIMTLYESKGLEFNDVLLYNFFRDSTATPNQWRLVLKGVSNGGHPTFDETRHASVCMELKFLYVAITRARNNLWIVDNSQSAEPMKVYWSSKGQIEIRSSTAEIPRLAVQSSDEEWLKRGRTMFLNQRYEQASVAFSRAKQNRVVKICDAYFLREKARLISTTAGETRIQAFVTAAKAFIACARDSTSQVNERLAYYGAAGECYLEARDLKKAGDNYCTAEQYLAAACAYQEGEHFDQMVEVINRHRGVIDGGLVERLETDAKVYYFKCLNMEAAQKFFHSKEDALVFLEKRPCLYNARVELLIGLSRILEAAGIYAENGNMLKAVRILSAPDTYCVDHARPMIDYLLVGLRQSLTLGVVPASNPTASRLLVHADRLDKSIMTESEIDELAMFKAIQRTNRASLRALAETFFETRNDPAALLCLDHYFSSPPRMRNLPFDKVEATLYLYLDYVHLLKNLRRDNSLASGSARQRLFGFQVLGYNRYLVSEKSSLHKILANQSGSGEGSADGHRCSHDELCRSINYFISNRTSKRTKIQDDAFRDAHKFSPCPQSLVQKECSPPEGTEPCTFQHVQPEELTADWYRARLRLILLQFRILDSACYDDLDVKNYWLGVLYSALHPPSQMLGSLANVDIENVTGGAGGLQVVREWVQYVCCDPKYNDVLEPTDRFKHWFMVACTLAFDLDRDNAWEYVPYTQMCRKTLWPRSLSREKVDLDEQEFVAFVTAESYDLLVFGSYYLREVLRSSPVRVDLIVLCDLVERLSGLFIMARRVGFEDALHDVTMPRSWFINLILPGTDLERNTSTFSTFTSTIIELMQRIDAQVRRHLTSPSETWGRFIADGSQVTSLTGPLYIARICLCLCLMGYNTNDEDLKENTLASIQSLRKGDEKFTPGIYQRYADSKDWDDLVHAFTESLNHSPLDEMILLVRTSIPGPSEQRPKCVRRVSYDELDEVPELLRSVTPRVLRSGTTSVGKQRTPAEMGTGVKPDGDRDRQARQKRVETRQ